MNRKRRRTNSNIKFFIGLAIIILGIIAALYVGGWIMFIQPIIACCTAFDAGLLTAAMIGWTVVKCIFASFVGGVIFWITYAIGMFVWQ